MAAKKDVENPANKNIAEDPQTKKQQKAIVKQLQSGVKKSQESKMFKDFANLKKTGIKKIVDGMVEAAYAAGASDIHVEPMENHVVVRARVDGLLHDVMLLPKDKHPMIITRIKVLAGLRTDEHRAAQDGRFRVTHDKIPIDLRVSIIPTFYGENVVMRLLVGKARALNLEELGFSKKDLKVLNKNIESSYGMILATGPTGSGKTTTLYSILQILNERSRSIITIEDPIEYAIPGITQIQTEARTGLTFAKGLRSILRQDPNIVMVGEIRDQETAGIAVNAAMTGHLMLSTLHTNDAAVTLPRLLDMGIEPFMIASTMNIAIGQRLVRKLCDKCAKARKLTKVERESLGRLVPSGKIKASMKISEADGCKKCGNSGYIGRIGIYEVLDVTERIRHLIMQRADASKIREAAIDEGMTTMLEDGLEKASSGVTSLEEVMRVIHE